MPRTDSNHWALFIIPVIAITTGLGLFSRILSPGQIGFGLALSALLVGAYFLTISVRERNKILKRLFHLSGLAMTLVGTLQLIYAAIR